MKHYYKTTIRGNNSRKIAKPVRKVQCLKLPAEMYFFIQEQIERGIFHSISEVVRFSLLIFFSEKVNIRFYLPKFYSLNFFATSSSITKKINTSVKLHNYLKEQLDNYKLQYKNYKDLTYTEIILTAIDHASDYFFFENTPEILPTKKY